MYIVYEHSLKMSHYYYNCHSKYPRKDTTPKCFPMFDRLDLIL